jgi:hypothetical protein
MNSSRATPTQLQEANNAVLKALDFARKLAVDGTGTDETTAPAVTAAIILLHSDGIAQTSVVGAPNKVSLYGALIDCILSINDIDKANQVSEIIQAHKAQMEKDFSDNRTDN